jgi:hypothetical protein
MWWDKTGESRGGECAWATGVWGELFTHAACPAVPVCRCCCCMWLPVLVPPPHMQVVVAMNASHTWHMHDKWRQKLLWRAAN